MLKKLGFGATAIALIAGASVALAAGLPGGQWNGFPILGNSGYCSSYVNGNCVNTVGPGEAAVTGNEMIPADSWLAGGQQPASELISVDTLGHIGEGSERNALRGGDFFTNLWQRGTTFTSLTPTTTTMVADGWGAYSSGNTTTITRQLTGTDISPTLGINGSMKIVRPSGTNTTAICVSQTLPARESQRFIGKQAVFSFSAQALSGFLSTNKNIVATIAVYTAADSATPGTNTDAFTKGTITDYTVLNPVTGTTAAPNLPITTSWARYSVTGTVPLTVASHAVTGIGVQICTPVYPASTGVAADGFEIANLQLEATVAPTTTQILGANNALVTVPLTPGNLSPGGFARRSPGAEAQYEQTFSTVYTDGAITRVFGWCQETTVNTSASCIINFPTQMREAPATTVSAAGWSVQQTNATNELCSALAGIASSNTVDAGELLCTNPGTIAIAVVSPFLGGATTSTITFSAEP